MPRAPRRGGIGPLLAADRARVAILPRTPGGRRDRFRARRRPFAGRRAAAARPDRRPSHAGADRVLRGRRGRRPGRDGGRVQGVRRGPESLRRHQDALAEPGGIRGGAPAVRAGRAGGRRGDRRLRAADLRRRRVAGSALPGHAVLARLDPAEAGRGSGAVGFEGDPPDRHAGRARPGGGARLGAGPSRREAVQHPDRRHRRAGVADRLRIGPRRRRRQHHAVGDDRRHAAVHVPRAGPRRGRGGAFGPLQPGRRPLFHVHRPAAVPRRQQLRRPAPHRRSGAEEHAGNQPRPARLAVHAGLPSHGQGTRESPGVGRGSGRGPPALPGARAAAGVDPLARRRLLVDERVAERAATSVVLDSLGVRLAGCAGRLWFLRQVRRPAPLRTPNRGVASERGGGRRRPAAPGCLGAVGRANRERRAILDPKAGGVVAGPGDPPAQRAAGTEMGRRMDAGSTAVRRHGRPAGRHRGEVDALDGVRLRRRGARRRLDVRRIAETPAPQKAERRRRRRPQRRGEDDRAAGPAAPSNLASARVRNLFANRTRGRDEDRSDGLGAARTRLRGVGVPRLRQRFGRQGRRRHLAEIRAVVELDQGDAAAAIRRDPAPRLGDADRPTHAAIHLHARCQRRHRALAGRRRRGRDLRGAGHRVRPRPGRRAIHPHADRPRGGGRRLHLPAPRTLRGELARPRNAEGHGRRPGLPGQQPRDGRFVAHRRSAGQGRRHGARGAGAPGGGLPAGPGTGRRTAREGHRVRPAARGRGPAGRGEFRPHVRARVRRPLPRRGVRQGRRRRPEGSAEGDADPSRRGDRGRSEPRRGLALSAEREGRGHARDVLPAAGARGREGRRHRRVTSDRRQGGRIHLRLSGQGRQVPLYAQRSERRRGVLHLHGRRALGPERRGSQGRRRGDGQGRGVPSRVQVAGRLGRFAL